MPKVTNNSTPLDGWLHFIDDALPEKVIESAYDIFSEVMIPSGSIMLSNKELEADVNDGPVNLFIKRVCSVVKEQLSITCEDVYFEVWSNRFKSLAGDIVDYHIDNNEYRRNLDGVVETPKFGSILYLGPDDMIGGATYFNPPLTDMSKDLNLFKRPNLSSVLCDDGIYVSFKSGRFIYFNGNCPHCVTNFIASARGPRVAILCNVWGPRL